MLGAYTICMAMFGSGVAIGMVIIQAMHKLTPLVLVRALIACSGAVVGAAARRTAGVLIVATATRLVVATAWASAWSLPVIRGKSNLLNYANFNNVVNNERNGMKRV